MATLSETEIEKLFSGAPQFFARSRGLAAGAPYPSVAFPYDEELAIRDLTDHTQIEDDAWGCVTACPHIIQRDPLSATSPSGRKRPHFTPKCQERPNMLSMQGLEKGTMGYQAALEISVADALQEEQYGFDSLGSKAHVIVERRQRLITSKDGLRHLDDSNIMEQLIKVEDRYEADRRYIRTQARDLYNELFTKILYPPARVIDREDPYGLAVQIHALVRILATPNAWVDFSHVEWRIRLGQVLWGFPLDDALADGSSINEDADAQDRSEERYWLLLQILLACELLVRLDAVTEGDEFGTPSLSAADVHRFEREANASVKWSLILARSWLENITVTKTNANGAQADPSTSKSWLATMTSKMSLKHEHMHGAHFTDHTQHRHNAQSEHIYAIQGRYTERQISGLMQFARKLRWPDSRTSIQRVSDKASTLGEATPMNTPLPTTGSHRSSYFGGDRSSMDRRRQVIRRRKVEAVLHSSGWLSKSYISGLILPGEVLSHCLMSTLLENDVEAMASLGPMANLCGGFIYNGKSFWSTACVVGRVLAAGQGSAECMGWISSDITPLGHQDGWVDIAVDDIPDDVAKTGKKARLWGKLAIEKESLVLGDADPDSVLPADFIIPHEGTYAERPPSNIRIDLKSLNLVAPVDSIHSTPSIEQQPTPSTQSSTRSSEIQTYPASASFTMSHDGRDQEIDVTYSLSNDVYFVTAHPCVASSHVKYSKSPTSPTIQQIDVGGQDFPGKPTASAFSTGHPLHRSYTYTAIHLVDLMSEPHASLESLLSRGTMNAQPRNNAAGMLPSRPPRVLVVDCINGMAPPSSPRMASLSRMSSSMSSSSFGLDSAASSPQLERRPSTATSTTSSIKYETPEMRMRLGTRRRQFGSDLEILVRALCAERGWNAIVSRRRRGCLACAIREAGALGWKVVLRVD
ncbi:hypothetical protein F4780DRAFT_744557 [Xylariomycetidae sp. FL0641]|nr:hypothetical protein F4780DRAFT_744557 [Xylariomycetidae sp. FL0641]